MKKETAIVYMAAGISSRFEGRIKQLIKLTDNQTFIEYSLNQALKSGFIKIIFIVGNKTEIPFKEIFGSSYKGIPVLYAKQNYNPKTRDKPWGTLDALCSAHKLLDCQFVICNGDDIYGENTFRILFNHLQESEEEATIGYKLNEVLPETGKTHRAIFKAKNNYVESLSEVFNIDKKDLKASNVRAEDLCSLNIFALNPKIINIFKSRLKLFKKLHEGDRTAECLLPNEISNLVKRNKIRMKIYPAVDKWAGITNPEDEEIVRNMISNIMPA